MSSLNTAFLSTDISQKPKFQTKKCKRFRQSQSGYVEVNLARDSMDGQQCTNTSENPDDLYKVLNDHWKQQFNGYILELDQVVIDPRPFSKGWLNLLNLVSDVKFFLLV